MNSRDFAENLLRDACDDDYAKLCEQLIEDLDAFSRNKILLIKLGFYIKQLTSNENIYDLNGNVIMTVKELCEPTDKL